MDAGVEIRVISKDLLVPELFAGFDRFQEVKRCWRKVEGQWVLKDVPFTEDWTPEDYRLLCRKLFRCVEAGGAVWGAFAAGALKGFACVEGKPIGSRGQYAVLAELHVSRDCRRQGLGRALFEKAVESARKLGVEKLYISAMSAEESQAFYRGMGCVEAEEYDPYHVKLEPCDCQMEYKL